MKKAKKNTKTSIEISDLFEILNKEIESYDIRVGNHLEKKMTLVKLKKELEKYIEDIT